MKSLAGNIPLKGLHELRGNLAQQQKCIEQAEGAEVFLQLDDQFHRTMFGLAGREFLWGCCSSSMCITSATGSCIC